MVLAGQLVTVYQTYLQTTPAPHAVHPATSSEST
jgi:hypothetical protein